MIELISKETLLNEIVNTPTNSDCYNSAYQTYTTAYHSGSATRQFEILDIVKKMPTVSEQEIRNKAISSFADWCYINGIDFSYMSTAKKSGRQFIDDVIARYCKEQMKEVGEWENE